jgi:hypothetical protein
MPFGDGHMSSETPSLDATSGPRTDEETFDRCTEIAAFVSFLQERDAPAHVFYEQTSPSDHVTRTGTTSGILFRTFAADERLVLFKMDGGCILWHTPSHTELVMSPMEIEDERVISITVVAPCDECGDEHEQDFACFLRSDSAGYFIESWIPHTDDA